MVEYSGQAIGPHLHELLHKLFTSEGACVCACFVAVAWLHNHFEAGHFQAPHLLILTLSCCQVNRNKQIIYLRGRAQGSELRGGGDARHGDLILMEKLVCPLLHVG